MEVLKHVLTQRERGLHFNDSFRCTANRRWSLCNTLRPARRSRFGGIVQLRTKEDYLVYLTQAGTAFLCTLAEGSTAQALTKPSERAIKFVLVGNELYLILMKRHEQFLRVYRMELPDAKGRKRVLAGAEIKPEHLTKIDPIRGYFVVTTASDFAIWSLLEERVVFASCHAAWYAKHSVVETIQTATHTVVKVTQLQSGESWSINLQGHHKIYQVEVLLKQLILGTEGRPVQVVDLNEGSVKSLGATVPKFYLETERMLDAGAVCADGHAYFASGLRALVSGTAPRFFDTETALYIYDAGQLMEVSALTGKTVVSAIAPRSEVTSMALNEDTQQLFLGLNTGNIMVLQQSLQ